MKRSQLLLVLVVLFLGLGLLAFLFGANGAGGRSAVDPDSGAASGETNSEGLAPGLAPSEPAERSGQPDAGRVIEDRTSPPRGSRSSKRGVRLRLIDDFDVPIAGATVRLARATKHPLDALERYGLSFEEELSDEDGRVVFSDVEPGAVGLLVRAELFETYEVRSRQIAFAQPDDLGSLVLVPGGRVTGWVRDESGVPIAGARLQAKIGDRSVPTRVRAALALTDANGRFQVDGLALARWELRVSHSAHPPKIFTGEFVPGSSVCGDVELVLAAGATITGRTNGVPNELAANLEVVARPMSSGLLSLVGTPERRARISKLGEFTLSGVTAGATYDVRLERRAGESIPLAVETAVQAPEQDVVLEWIEPASLTVDLMSASGDSLPVDVFVSLSVNGVELLSEADGTQRAPNDRLVLSGLRLADSNGPCTITVGAVGFLSVTEENWSLRAGEQLTLGPLVMKERLSAQLRLVHAGSGEPWPTLHVSISPMINEVFVPGHYEGLTDRDGLVRLDLPDDSMLDVSATLKEDEIFGEQFPLSALLGGTVTFQVPELAVVEVLVLDRDGRPRGDARVQLSCKRTDVMTGSDGVARFEDVPCGRATVLALPGEVQRTRLAGVNTITSRSDAVVFTVLKQGVTRVEIVAADEVRVEGHVSVNGQPLVGALVRMVAESDASSVKGELLASTLGPGSVRSDYNGRFVFDGLGRGMWQCLVEHPDRASVASQQIELNLPLERIDVELDGGTLEGRVVDASGRGIPNARVDVMQGRLDKPTRVRKGDAELSTHEWAGQLFRITQGVKPTARTDAEGRFKLNGLDPTRNPSLVATAPGWGIAWILVLPYTTEDVTLTLHKAGELAVRIENSEGALKPGRTWISIEPASSHNLGGMRRGLALDGLLSIDSLPPGRYSLSIEGGFNRRGVRVEAGERVNIVLRY